MAQANGNVEVEGPHNTTPNVPASEADETVQLSGEPTAEVQPQPAATGSSQTVASVSVSASSAAPAEPALTVSQMEETLLVD